MTYLSNICPFKLNDSYDTLYNLQQKLEISDEYLHSIAIGEEKDIKKRELLQKLLAASKETRDNLITWYTKQSLVELNVTISLLTAKIKFIEYRLGQCEGLDLHQACSLSLVNFCNILSDMTILNVRPSDRKTMHMVSHEAGVPIWLSHYRNQICHVPSESPCISILAPLITRALGYMRDSFWSRVVERDTFEVKKCRRTIMMISNYTKITSINHNHSLESERNEAEIVGKKRLKMAKDDFARNLRFCASLRRQLSQNPNQVLELLVDCVMHYNYNDKTKNCALLLEQVILARCFERFLNRLISYAEDRIHDKMVLSWLMRVITLISFRKKEKIRKTMKKMNLWVSVKMVKLLDIPAVKCCQIAYRLMKLDHPIVRKLIIRMRHKLEPVLGRKRTLLLISLTNVAKT